MKLFKSILVFIICFFIILFTLVNINKITDYFIPLIDKEPALNIKAPNTYKKTTSFGFVKNTDNFTPLSKGDIKNIFYTIVNNGWKEFTFYCPKEYTNCLEDIENFSQDQTLLTHINNFVHPYNSFSNIKTIINENGTITISITYYYNIDHIKALNEKIDNIYNELIKSNMNDATKIKEFHDYIINNSKYDVTRNEKLESDYQSYLAYGPLFEGYATCNGYTDAMALFLEKLNIPNYKIATTPVNIDEEGHVWNAIFLDNKWLHLDLTWDDPVSSDGKDYLLDKYFLITTKELEGIDNGDIKITEHQFRKDIYLEMKEN